MANILKISKVKVHIVQNNGPCECFILYVLFTQLNTNVFK